jgi:hypothetical protein
MGVEEGASVGFAFFVVARAKAELLREPERRIPQSDQIR